MMNKDKGLVKIYEGISDNLNGEIVESTNSRLVQIIAAPTSLEVICKESREMFISSLSTFINSEIKGSYIVSPSGDFEEADEYEWSGHYYRTTKAEFMTYYDPRILRDMIKVSMWVVDID